MVAMRNDYFIPDTLVVNPSTMGALRKVKDSQGRYLLGLLSSAKEIDQTSETESFWDLNVIQTTKQAAGQAVLLSVRGGAGVVYIREPLSTFFDPYSLAAQNTYQYIAEIRFALTVPRKNAVSLISGLPAS
jgi:HK97 family phage major capsid protein